MNKDFYNKLPGLVCFILDEWKIYLEKFKKEIDDLYERVSNRENRTIIKWFKN